MPKPNAITTLSGEVNDVNDFKISLFTLGAVQDVNISTKRNLERSGASEGCKKFDPIFVRKRRYRVAHSLNDEQNMITLPISNFCFTTS